MPAFNHYAKMKRILDERKDSWIIKRINEPTSAKNFKGETIEFTHYYRVYDSNGEPIKYCKFQSIERFASAFNVGVETLPVVE